MNLTNPTLERLRRVLLPLALIAAVVGLAVFTDARVPMQRWLFWPYAGFCLAALVWAAACLSVGHALLRCLPAAGLPFRERLLLDFATGVLVFALGVFLAGLCRLLGQTFFFAYPLLLLAAGAPSLIGYLRRGWRHFGAARRRASLRPSALYVAAVALGTLGLAIVYLTIMLPENASFDARTYHLPLAEHYAAWGRVGRFPEGWYASVLPHLSSWIYVWPFTLRTANLFGRVEIAAHIEFLLFVVTLLSTPLLVEAICPGRRARGTWALFFLFPGLFLYDSSLGLGADHVLAFWAVPLALSVRRLLHRPTSAGRAALVGLMMAGAALTKYQAIYFLAPAALVVLTVYVRALLRQPTQRRALLVHGLGALATSALVATAPHWLSNTFWHGNPVYPLLGKLFPSHPWVPGWKGPTMDSGWEPTGTLIERIGETVAATVRFSFIPHDWAPFHRDLPVFGFLFTLTLPVLLLARGTRRAWVLAGSTLLGVGIWYWTYHQDRYLQALLPWMVACTAAALMFAWQAGWIARAATMALVALQLVWGGDVAWLPTHAMMRDVPAMRSMHMLSSTFRDEWKSRLRFDTGFEELDKTLPKDATVLLHEEYLKLGLNRRALADSARWQGAIDYRQLRRPDRVHEKLKSLGVTHIVWSRSHSVNREIPVSGELVFFDYAMRHGADQHDEGGFAVAEPPARTPPAQEPGDVAFFGCKGVQLLPLADVDEAVNREGEGSATPGDDPAALLAKADFAVVDERCRAAVLPQVERIFRRAPRWAELSLWVRGRE